MPARHAQRIVSCHDYMHLRLHSASLFLQGYVRTVLTSVMKVSLVLLLWIIYYFLCEGHELIPYKMNHTSTWWVLALWEREREVICLLFSAIPTSLSPTSPPLSLPSSLPLFLRPCCYCQRKRLVSWSNTWTQIKNDDINNNTCTCNSIIMIIILFFLLFSVRYHQENS